MTATEGLVYVAGLIWGKNNGSGNGAPVRQIETADAAHQFASLING